MPLSYAKNRSTRQTEPSGISISGLPIVDSESEISSFIPSTNNERLNELVRRLMILHNRKNHDYARDLNPYSNFEEAAEYAGVSVDQAIRVLMGVKVARLRELLSADKTPNNESIQDTKDDLALYTLIWASY